ncbi:MAG: energy-coupling factor transporter transmembrane protein EcfT, partial [Clostridia bacterium]|nr:energy-coupling factor transporter transmembrane protein EcfT [Clostridia bacterium]
MKNIALGQYYPAKSPIHRTDPRIKVILAILYIVCATFLAKNVVSFALLLLSSLFMIAAARIPFKTVLRGIVPVLFVMAFAAVFQVFGRSGDMLLLEWKFIHIYAEGIYAAVFMIIRIFALIVGTSIFLTYTTTPIELTDAIEDLLS